MMKQITASRANNYWCTINDFYLEFVHEFFKSIYKTK